MSKKIEKAIAYYTFKSKELLEEVNLRNDLTVDQIIEKGKALGVLEYKITALEVAKEN